MRVLFVDTVHPVLDQTLSEHGFSCVFDYTASYEELLEKIAAYDGLIIRSRIPVDRTFLAAAKNLKFIARSGAGLENIDLAAAAENGVVVFNSPEGNMDAVGEHIIGMLLMLFHKLKQADTEVRQGLWRREENRGVELSAKTVGIIGFGNMGSALAKKLSGFGCRILAYDKYKSDYAPPYVTETTLGHLQEASDIISLHLPLSVETNYYLNDDFINSCQKPFYLVNTSRGRHVDTAALVAALKSGKIAGACLDVVEYETKSFETLDMESMPEAFQYLCASSQTVLSPHVAGWTTESYRKLSSFLAEKIIAWHSTLFA